MWFPGLADAALGEGTGVKLHKLSVREIKAVRSFVLLSHIITSIHALFVSSSVWCLHREPLILNRTRAPTTADLCIYVRCFGLATHNLVVCSATLYTTIGYFATSIPCG